MYPQVICYNLIMKIICQDYFHSLNPLNSEKDFVRCKSLVTI